MAGDTSGLEQEVEKNSSEDKKRLIPNKIYPYTALCCGTGKQTRLVAQELAHNPERYPTLGAIILHGSALKRDDGKETADDMRRAMILGMPRSQVKIYSTLDFLVAALGRSKQEILADDSITSLPPHELIKFALYPGQNSRDAGLPTPDVVMLALRSKEDSEKFKQGINSSRDARLESNRELFERYGKSLKGFCGAVVNLSNPTEKLLHVLFQQGFPARQGVSFNEIDSTSLRYFLALTGKDSQYLAEIESIFREKVPSYVLHEVGLCEKFAIQHLLLEAGVPYLFCSRKEQKKIYPSAS